MLTPCITNHFPVLLFSTAESGLSNLLSGLTGVLAPCEGTPVTWASFGLLPFRIWRLRNADRDKLLFAVWMLMVCSNLYLVISLASGYAPPIPGNLLEATVVTGAVALLTWGYNQLFTQPKTVSSILSISPRRANRPVMVTVENQAPLFRKQLARDLHDNVGSKLTHVIHSLDLITLNFGGYTENTHRLHLEKVSQLTREAMQMLRETVWIIHQPDLTGEQFTVRLREYLNQHLTYWETISFSLATEGDLTLRLSSEQAFNLFCIMQESVANVLRHADATQLQVILSCQPGQKIRLRIMDNGKGFDTSRVRKNVGLVSLLERTAGLGGTLHIQSSTEQPIFVDALPGQYGPIPPTCGIVWKTLIDITIPLTVQNTSFAV